MWIVIQARSNSTRLPNKVMAEVGGVPIIDRVYSLCSTVLPSIVAVPYDDKLGEHLYHKNIPCFYGTEKDVLGRYWHCATSFRMDKIMRITADCPAHNISIIHFMATVFQNSDLDFFTNNSQVDGWDVECLSYRLLNYMHEKATDPEDREHVTRYFLKADQKRKLEFANQKFKSSAFELPIDHKWIPKLSVDTIEDLERVRKLCDK